MLNLKGFIVCCCILHYSAEFMQLYSIYDETFDNKYHLSNAVHHSTVTLLSQCAMLCLQSMRCLSYFYNTQSGECILHAISFKHTVPSFAGMGWKFHLTEDRSSRCTINDGFIYYKDLDFCYKIYDPSPRDFMVYKSICEQANAELVKVDTKEKQKYIELITADLSVLRLCVQGTDTIDSQQRWTFDDGTLMTYFNWNHQYNQPSGGQGYIGISVVRNFTWFDIVASTPSSTCNFICQK